MNYKFISFLFLLAFLASNCKDKGEELLKPSLYTGETTFLLNLDSIIYCTYGVRGDKNGIEGIYIFSDLIHDFIQTRSLVFFIPGYSGIFSFHEEFDPEKRFSTARYYYKDADVLLASYHIPEQKANGSVSILQYNPESGEISGEFECTLYLKNNYDLNNAPDSLVIRNGHFQTIVED